MLIKALVQSGWIKGIRLTLARPYLNTRYSLLSPKPQKPIATHRWVATVGGGGTGGAAHPGSLTVPTIRAPAEGRRRPATYGRGPPPLLARGTRLARRPLGLRHSASCLPAAAPGCQPCAPRTGIPSSSYPSPSFPPPAAARPRPTGRTGTRGRGMGAAGAAAPPSLGGGRLAAGARLPAPQPMRAAGRGWWAASRGRDSWRRCSVAALPAPRSPRAASAAPPASPCPARRRPPPPPKLNARRAASPPSAGGWGSLPAVPGAVRPRPAAPRSLAPGAAAVGRGWRTEPAAPAPVAR